MEKIYTREFVLQVLQNVLEFERGTLDLYRDYLGRLTDIDVGTVFIRLRDEEVQHVNSVEELIEKLK